MLDIKQIRAQQKEIERTLRKRLDTIDFTELLAWDEQRRKFIAEAGCLKATRNEVSARISQLKKAGQFPKFADEVFHLQSPESGESAGFLLPTAETALVNLHREEILPEEALPRRYFAYTPCYRREAGSYRTRERGMIRGHQFNKVELFQFTRPADSEAALEELIQKAESLVQGLELHYRVSRLAAQDCSAAMAKTYDIEVWIPSMGEYKEVSSASNARDYQARRGNIRYRNQTTRQNEFVHTLNASGLATSRLLPALVEQHQRPDGSVPVPEVLRKWVGQEVLHPQGDL